MKYSIVHTRSILRFLLIALVLAPGLRAAEAGDVRAIEIMGLRAGATVAEVDARFPLDTTVIYAEPLLPSLGIYLYRADHEAITTTADGVELTTKLDAHFDRAGRLFRWNLVRTAPDKSLFTRVIDDVIAAYGPPDRASDGPDRMIAYAMPWPDGIPGPEARLRLVLDEVGTDQTRLARLTVNFMDYRAETHNRSAAYWSAVDAEWVRLGGPPGQTEIYRQDNVDDEPSS